jgi:hypothetical protein
MPQCRRCERVQATAELRRTTRGYVCKDNGRWSRCWTIARELRAVARAAQRARSKACAQMLEALRGACGELILTLELLARDAPHHWILGRPSPAELQVGIAEVAYSLARFDLALAGDLAGEVRG